MSLWWHGDRAFGVTWRDFDCFYRMRRRARRAHRRALLRLARQARPGRQPDRRVEA